MWGVSMAKVMYCGLKVSKFELQLCYSLSDVSMKSLTPSPPVMD